MLEFWNVGHAVKLFCAIMGSGIMGLENQNECNCIDILNSGVFSGAKAENRCLTGIIVKCKYNFFIG
jgi:hypothetical protein